MNREAYLTDFEFEDLSRMEADIDEYDSLGDFHEKLDKVLEVGEAKTIWYHEAVLGVMGYFELWPGTCETWIIAPKEIKHKGIFGIIVRDAVNKLMARGEFHRIQATAKDNEVNKKFFRKMNFEAEGILEKYSTSKENYIMWGRVS